MAPKKKATGKTKTSTPAAKLRDLDALDSKVKKVKGGALRKRLRN